MLYQGFNNFAGIQFQIFMKYVILLFLVMVMEPSGFAQDPEAANCQLATVLQIDGLADEWPMEWLTDDDKKFSYNVCSDDNNLYIRMKTNDELVRRKIALFGLTVWMDPKGKKKEKLGLKFPTGAEAHDRIEAMSKSTENTGQMSSSQRAAFQKEMIKSVIKDAELLELLGLADDPLTSTRSGITNGIKVAIASDEEGLTLTYEAIIPFKSFRLSKASISVIGIGFETGKFVPPPSKSTSGGANTNQGYSGSGRGSSAYGGGYGGGSGMGRGMGNPTRASASSPMSSTTSFWAAVKLK